MAVIASSITSFPVHSHGEKIRSLASMEEIFWLYEQCGSFCPVLLAEVEGAITIEGWRRALNTIQDRYPHLRFSIRKDRGSRPYFVSWAEPLELRAIPMTDVLSLTEEMQKEQQNPFGAGNGALTRATLLYGHDSFAVLLAAHHSVADGKSNFMVLQDLLAAIAGEDLGPTLALGPTGDEVLDLQIGPYSNTLEDNISLNVASDLISQSKSIRIKRLQLAREETSYLLRRAKEEKTTVHGALIAALVLAGRRYSKAWCDASVRCLTTIDLRSIVKNLPEAPGVLLTACQTVIESTSNQTFWGLARMIQEDVSGSKTLEFARSGQESYSQLIQDEHAPEQFQAMTRHNNVSFDLAVSNYGNYKQRTDFGRLKLKSIFSSGPAAPEMTQKVSSITVNGILGMTLVSKRPFPTLLEDARDIIIRA